MKKKSIWIFGIHSCLAALKNKARRNRQFLITKRLFWKHSEILNAQRDLEIKILTRKEIRKLIPSDFASHSAALQTEQIIQPTLVNLLRNISNMPDRHNPTIVILDQITDVVNIGTILRSAACFGIDAALMCQKCSHSDINDVAISRASGAYEIIPVISVTNLTNTILLLKKNGFWCYALDEKGQCSIDDVKFSKRSAIILGSEGTGIRKRILQSCDEVVSIKTCEKFSSLNVSSAAAVAFHALKNCERN